MFRDQFKAFSLPFPYGSKSLTINYAENDLRELCGGLNTYVVISTNHFGASISRGAAHYVPPVMNQYDFYNGKYTQTQK